jgi:ATP phosphoribosyltransferase
MNRVSFAIPSKGRLQEQTLAFFQDAGLAIEQFGGERGYVARMRALPEVDVRLLSASDIAAGLRDGELHAGVTGEDLLRELGAAFADIVMVAPLGFGRADLVVAVPASWLDVSCMADLEAVAAEHRIATGRRLRVATKYVRQARAFFEAQGVDDFRIVESLGATEGAPAAGVAEVVVDITTTGATLAANHLKTLADGLILHSEAQIAASRRAGWDEASLTVFCRLLDQIDARARAKRLRLVRVSCAGASRSVLHDLFGAAGAVEAHDQSDTATLVFYCPAESLAGLCAEAAASGAGPIAVLAAEYVYEHGSATAKRFSTALSIA